jgi:hypothetical protein
MKTSDLIEGLTILKPYYDREHTVDAGREVLYASATKRPLTPEDVQRMVALGWIQEDVDHGDDDFGPQHYDPEEGWAAYT